MADGPTRVLLVEDDEDDYFLTKELFRDLRDAYHLDRVADFESAIIALTECSHDLYLVDYRLGRRTGLELITEARALGCPAPMIMLTGQQEREIDVQAMRAGAVDYLVKDRLDAAILERSMRYALQQKRHEEMIRRVNLELEQRVKLRTAELDSLNRTLQSEVVERQRAEAAVREASQRKDEFLATLAHELRNPLAAVNSALQLLQPLPADPAQVSELHQIMRRQVEQLVRLIDDLMDMSRISRGKLTLRRERVAIQDVIHAALDVSRSFVSAGNHELTIEMPREPVYVDADRVRISQIVSNLLVNSAKYTPQGGKIVLRVVVEGRRVVIHVVDNGIGIPAEMLPRIFDLFTQVDSSKTRSHGGLGIGLTLVKTLVEMHGGEVQVASDGPGRGSRFTVLLSQADAPAQPVEPPPPPTPAAQLPQLPRMSVLIVDDNESAAYLLQRLLNRLSQDVHSVNSAADALKIIGDVQPHVVISDIGMPEMSGYELARAIRHRTDLPQPTLIALTGYGKDTDRMEAVRAGFDYHLCKPIGIDALAQILQMVSPSSTTKL
jgi:signal transduction histidine kinase